MLKREILFILFLLLNISIISAEDFSGYKYYDEPFTLNGDNFSLRLSGDQRNIIFTNDFEKVLVGAGNCEITVKYSYCFTNAIVDLDNGIGKISYHTDNDIPALNLSITSLLPDITIERSTNNNPMEFESVIVEIKFENKGKKDANIIYTEYINSTAKLLNCEKCIIFNNGENIEYRTLLQRGDADEFRYEINPKNYKISLTPNITYSSSTQNGSLKTSTMTITPQKIFTISYEGSKILNVEEIIDAEIIFKNELEKEDINFISELTFPINFDVSFNNKFDGNELNIEEKIFNQQEKKFKIYIRSKFSGKNNLTINSNYTYLTEKLNKTEHFELDVQVPKPELILGVNDNMYSDMSNNVNLTISTNKVNSFKNIFISINIGDEISENFQIPFLRHSRSLLAYNKHFTLESITSKKININAKIEYQTVFGESFIEELSKEITVIPITDSFSVTHNIHDFIGSKGDLIISTMVSYNSYGSKRINITDEIMGSKVLNYEGNEVSDYKKITKNKGLYLISGSNKKAYTYVLKETEYNKSQIITSITVHGAKNNYLIKINSELDFNKKTIEQKNKSYHILSKTNWSDKSGINRDTIEFEKELSYDIKYNESNDEIELNDSINGSSNLTIKIKEEPVVETNIEIKKSFWQKVKSFLWGIIKI